MLLKAMGSNPTAPFLIDMHYVEGGTPASVRPMNEETIACNESCSCQDCVEACRNPGVYPNANGSQCVVGTWDCFHFISTLLFFLFVITVIVFWAVQKAVMGTPLPESAASFDKDIDALTSQEQIGCIDAIRLNWENGLQYLTLN